LIAFQGQDVIGLLVHDRGGNLFLSPHRVDGHNGTGQCQPLQKIGNGGNLIFSGALPHGALLERIAFGIYKALGENQTGLMGIGR
jgi:hypothetical protein